MIPLPPNEIAQMWDVLKAYTFKSTHGAFVGTDVYSDEVKSRVLESMKIQVRNEVHKTFCSYPTTACTDESQGYLDHRLLNES